MIDPTAFIHPLADVADGAVIGARTKVWQFVVVLAGARVGSDCNLNAHTLIEGGAIYPVFDRFILHVEAYRATIAKWKDADAESGESYLDRSANGSK